MFEKYKINTNIYPDLIGKEAFIGIRTTTCEVFSMTDVDFESHKHIGHLNLNVVNNCRRVLRNQNYNDDS